VDYDAPDCAGREPMSRKGADGAGPPRELAQRRLAAGSIQIAGSEERLPAGLQRDRAKPGNLACLRGEYKCLP